MNLAISEDCAVSGVMWDAIEEIADGAQKRALSRFVRAIDYDETGEAAEIDVAGRNGAILLE